MIKNNYHPKVETTTTTTTTPPTTTSRYGRGGRTDGIFDLQSRTTAADREGWSSEEVSEEEGAEEDICDKCE